MTYKNQTLKTGCSFILILLSTIVLQAQINEFKTQFRSKNKEFRDVKFENAYSFSEIKELLISEQNNADIDQSKRIYIENIIDKIADTISAIDIVYDSILINGDFTKHLIITKENQGDSTKQLFLDLSKTLGAVELKKGELLTFVGKNEIEIGSLAAYSYVQLDSIEGEYLKASRKFKNAGLKYSKAYKSLSKRLESEIEKKENDNSTRITAQPEQLANGNFFQPNIAINGVKQFGKNFFHELKYFVGNGLDNDSLATLNMLKSEVSKMGISLVGAYDVFSNEKKQSIGFTYKVHYLQKEFSNIGKDSISYDLDVVHLEAGAVWVIIRDVLSVYGDLLFVKPITKKGQFDHFFNGQKEIKSHDIGIRAIFDNAGEGGAFLLDLNLLNEVNSRFKQDNYYTPTLKISYRKTFK